MPSDFLQKAVSYTHLLALAKLMLDHDNLLLLDEPTNHLDIPAKEALEEALMKYDGTILFVSHDRMFLKKMANRILKMEADKSSVYNPVSYTHLDVYKRQTCRWITT